MYIFILLIHIAASLMLIAVILLQAGRGGGLAESFGGGGSQTTIFGQKATTFLTKATTVSAVLFLCTSLSLAVLSSKRQQSIMEKFKTPAPTTQTEEGVTGVPEAAEGEGQVKTTVKHIKVDPATGEETIVKEEVIPPKDAKKVAEEIVPKIEAKVVEEEAFPVPEEAPAMPEKLQE